MPARGYSWEPFKNDNAVALKHGTGSERAIAAKLPETRRDVLEVAPWVGRVGRPDSSREILQG
jgi:hypothetical protein